MQLISVGAVGPEVLDIQRRLEDLGYPSGDDPGVFGNGTHEAVRVFQQRRGLTADGMVGEDTWRSLVEAGYELGDRMLYLTRPMLRGDDVRDLQRRLNRLGFDTGHADGVFGTSTFEALREFQLNMGIQVDGIAGPSTIDALKRLHRQHQEAPAFAVKEREALRFQKRLSIAGARVMVDPGHSVEYPGLVADDGTAEHEITWDIGNRVAGRLAALGARVIMSRGPLTAPSSSDRAALANAEEVEAILSVHLNGLTSPAAHGAAAYYYGQDTYVSERGRRLAQLAVDNIVARTGTPNCRTHPSTSTLLRESRAPAVIVEPGFLTHPDEGRLLRDPDHQGLIAQALTDALVTFVVGMAPTGEATPAGEAIAQAADVSA
ncbi:MAG: N-acetylmuramoyl-L-alanine amidase [Actinobacteria bacterium]|nr:N-acetylmuramoyl-L-alanine amidase [Actinomycetota bacterium]